jgi:CheY-like chemotaxis protein
MSLKSILLVDDDKAFNFVTRIFLKESIVNCRISEALNGQQALDHLLRQDESPDVILLDLNMPEVNGFEFLEEFAKLDGRFSATKIFVLSSSVLDEDKAAVLSHKVVKGYFDKPLTDHHIAQILAIAES